MVGDTLTGIDVRPLPESVIRRTRQALLHFGETIDGLV